MKIPYFISHFFGGRAQLPIIDDEGEGPTVMMVHGIAASAAAWKNLLPLAKKEYRCVTVDLLGFGSMPSAKQGGYTIDDQVRALNRTIQSLGSKEQVVLIGHSMGALIAARYAATYKKKVSRLVMVAPPIYMDPHELTDPLARSQMDFYLKAYDFLRENKNFTLRNAKAIKGLLPVPESLDINETTWASFVNSLENMIESQTTLNDIAETTAPVTVLYGTLDPLNHPQTLKIVARFRDVEVIPVQGGGHIIGKKTATAIMKSLA